MKQEYLSPEKNIQQQEIEQYMMKHRHVWFDVYAKEFHISKKTAKIIWNNLWMGIKKFPNTIIGNYVKPIKRPDGLTKKVRWRDIYEYIDDFVYFDDDTELQVIYKWYQTDFWTIPLPLQPIINPQHVSLVIASQQHDKECSAMRPNRIKADFRFFKNILYFKMPLYKALPMYILLAIWGLFTQVYYWIRWKTRKARDYDTKFLNAKYEYLKREWVLDDIISIVSQK